MYTLILTRRAQKDFEKLPFIDQQRLLSAMHEIAAEPFAGKKLEGDLEGRYAWRVWPYRIIYRIVREMITVTVVAIGHRKNVYQKAQRR